MDVSHAPEKLVHTAEELSLLCHLGGAEKRQFLNTKQNDLVLTILYVSLRRCSHFKSVQIRGKLIGHTPASLRPDIIWRKPSTLGRPRNMHLTLN